MTPNRIDIVLGNGEKVLSDPGQEYVVSGQQHAYVANGGVLLAQVYDDVVRQYGSRVYELMEAESACNSALWMLRAGALGDGLQLTPEIEAQPGEVVSKRKKRADIKISAEIYESCERVIAGLGEGVVYDTIDQLYGGLSQGCKVAEQVFTLSESGDDRGRQVPTVFETKPNWAWAFRVDPFMRVTHYRCWTTEGWRDVEANHFTRFSWRPKDGDPRGVSIFRGCYTPFNLMMQAYPDYGEYLRKFASAALVLKAGPNAQDTYSVDPISGARTTKSVQSELIDAGRKFKQHSVLALPNGAEAQVLQSTGTGQAFLSGFDFCERQMFRQIILSTRPMQEAKHGSKADSESGLDIFQMAVDSVRKPMAGAFRNQFLRRYVELNWGPELAARRTPKCGFGASDHLSPDLMQAFSDAWSKGLFDEEHRPYIWSKIGAPTPEGWTVESSRAIAPGQEAGPDGKPVPPDPNAPAKEPNPGKQPITKAGKQPA